MILDKCSSDNYAQDHYVKIQEFEDHHGEDIHSVVSNEVVGSVADLIVCLLQTGEFIVDGSNSAMLTCSSSASETLHNQILLTIQTTKISFSTILVGLILLTRIFKSSSRQVIIHRHQFYYEQFLTSIICAEKYLNDSVYTNKDWCGFSSFRCTLNELNNLEKEFLINLNYRIHIPTKKYLEFIDELNILLHARKNATSFWNFKFNTPSFLLQPSKKLGDFNSITTSIQKHPLYVLELLVFILFSFAATKLYIF
ncbi:hypothetical protein BC833DRAFT_259963 [Globomyces pollinis-pini]|nr:hypothetical protein BC833DRAFT_259963 [Globomyces pollinis-pini]